ncbi:hypothetical protein [Marinimicrobium sp. ABcell2]|nr:hypothetical protein [Marinimicrobium sp. ABcell2]MDQ2077504.1 hypothetical protein [Marinimicrobium sp. ABcell2]
MLSWDDYEDDAKTDETKEDEILGGVKAPKEVPKACSIDEPDCDACQ